MALISALAARPLSLRLPRAGWVLAALLPALPILVVFAALPGTGIELWLGLWQTVLPEYLINSLLLGLGVGAGTLLLGLFSAWLVTRLDFPGRSLLAGLFLLPLALPAYILAYTYTGLLAPEGWLQTGLRELLGTRGALWPDIRSLPGAILIFSLGFYPYVYLLAREALRAPHQGFEEAARTLGQRGWRLFLAVRLPLIRPALFAGVMLALMETMADYGAVYHFGVPTFTTGILRTWHGLGDVQGAMALAAVLAAVTMTLFVLELRARGRARFDYGRHARPILPRRLSRGQALAAWLAGGVIVTLGFGAPLLQLGLWALPRIEQVLAPDFQRLLIHSLLLALGAAGLITALALLLALGVRRHPSPLRHSLYRLAGLGYAVPGMVIALGLMIPLGQFDRWLNAQGIVSGLLFSGGLLALLWAYLSRFLALGQQGVESGLATLRPSLTESARLLGLSPWRSAIQVHLPLLRGSLITVLILAFVETLKELPATLVLRPFNFNTLAVRAHELASDERLADAALPALCIVLLSLPAVILLARLNGRAGLRDAHPLT
ncbi:iron ABC transporter permease [Thiofaba sp. EF100]|uniref:ABC transporter permease n=1 Tax=Thiofaba sp. EF100 TaxID=3121274 RepID=UPI003221C66B